MDYFDGVPVRWDKLKPGCRGCIYLGSAIPCQYILITGKSPQSQGAHIDPEGPGGCELKETKHWRRRKATTPLPQTQLAPQKAAEVQTPSLPAKSVAHRKKPSKLDAPEFLALYHAGKTDREIAEAAGVAMGTVLYWRKTRGLPTKWNAQKQ